LQQPHIAGAAETSIEPHPWKEAMLWLLLLAPVFLIAYTTANLYAAQLPAARVHEVGMGWERSIPFLPWTILLYLSIYLLYVAAPFLCRTRRELRVHAGRFALATAISVVCFVLFPLRFGPARPHVNGIPSLLFDLVGSIDHRYNQAPSLHIGLLVVLWSCYRRHCPSRWTWLLNLGFACIATSVLTTRQHHFFDIPTGFAVGVLACRVITMNSFPRARAAQPILPI
jgi:cytochrome bd-type quinol oxidase subunit 2